ncbi:MAG: hypothetical protein HZB16_24065 [Armatimonadetes bacterium]|nr:hypothetical protein [Armatimonadota bacterium]
MNSNPRQEALDQALLMASRHRRKGDSAAAWRCVDDALTLAPESAPVFEMMGLLNLDVGEWQAALDCFGRALAIEPGRKNAEIGLGQATVELKRVESLTPEAIMAQTQLKRDLEKRAHVAAIFSFCLPGLGQMRLLDFGRGGGFMLGELLLGLLWWACGFGLAASGRGGRMAAPHPTAAFWLGAIVFFVYHCCAALDCNRLGRQIAEEEAQWL